MHTLTQWRTFKICLEGKAEDLFEAVKNEGRVCVCVCVKEKTSEERMTGGIRHGSKNGRSGREGVDRLCAAAIEAASGAPVSRHCSSSFRVNFAESVLRSQFCG